MKFRRLNDTIFLYFRRNETKNLNYNIMLVPLNVLTIKRIKYD